MSFGGGTFGDDQGRNDSLFWRTSFMLQGLSLLKLKVQRHRSPRWLGAESSILQVDASLDSTKTDRAHEFWIPLDHQVLLYTLMRETVPAGKLGQGHTNVQYGWETVQCKSLMIPERRRHEAVTVSVLPQVSHSGSGPHIFGNQLFWESKYTALECDVGIHVFRGWTFELPESVEPPQTIWKVTEYRSGGRPHRYASVQLAEPTRELRHDVLSVLSFFAIEVPSKLLLFFGMPGMLHEMTWPQISFVAEDNKGRVVGYVLARMFAAMNTQDETRLTFL